MFTNCIYFKILYQDNEQLPDPLCFIEMDIQFGRKNYMVTFYKYCTSAWTIVGELLDLMTIFYYLMK